VADGDGGSEQTGQISPEQYEKEKTERSEDL
jgi:hypothetical protein